MPKPSPKPINTTKGDSSIKIPGQRKRPKQKNAKQAHSSHGVAKIRKIHFKGDIICGTMKNVELLI